MRRKTTTRPYRNLVGLLAINILSIFVQSLSFAQIVPHYVIQLESARKESQGHFSAFSYGETFKWDHNCSHQFFLEIVQFFLPIHVFLTFCCPSVFLLATGMGNLWQAIRGKQSSPAWQSQLPEGRDFWGRYWRSRILNIDETWKKYWWRWSGLLRAILEEKINLKTNLLSTFYV